MYSGFLLVAFSIIMHSDPQSGTNPKDTGHTKSGFVAI